MSSDATFQARLRALWYRWLARHYDMCADVEEGKARDAKRAADYYRSKAVLARHDAKTPAPARMRRPTKL